MNIDRTWHLAATESEIKLTEFEFQLWRIYYEFIRWQEECEKTANCDEITSDDLAVLHIIRMRDRPKTVAEIGRLINRDSYFSVDYNLKKLMKLGLIKEIRADNKSRKQYIVTEKGKNNTDKYTHLRKNTLIKEFERDLSTINLEEITNGLMKLKGLYSEAARLVSSYQPATNHEESEAIKKDNNK